MAWDHLSVTKPHLVYILLGAFTTIFMLVSSFIKERMYIGEATVATIFGVIFGPHAANLINPLEWGNVDIVTIEFSRIVLVVQCFAIGVELPKFYMERHWKSVVYLLLPVMAFGWLIVSLVVWWMVPRLSWLESLAVAACVTATDPVLASSVVGKGKFAQRVPKHLRDLLSAESGCNDGMAFPFIYLALYLIMYNQNANEVAFHWFCFTILYECVFGAFYGFMVGYLARHGIKWAHEHDMIDRESFLVFYFVVALFCAGSGSILGVDDLLVGFAAGVGFSNDGWFGEKTDESHVSNVIDLLLNLTYFVFLGTIIPWEMYNDAALGLSAWRLSVLAIFVILFRRIPVMMMLKPFIPELKNWRETLFAGHFGPIGVGAIFVALLARAELEHHDPVPMSELPDSDVPHYSLLVLVWPITTFLVISSMIIHGSSVAVFTLGKRITTLPLTISFTQANEDGPTWMNRLPRISSMSRSQGKGMSDTEGEDLRMPELPPGTMPPLGLPHNFLRRQKEEEAGGGSRPQSRASSLLARRRKKKWDDGIGPGGPVSQSAIMPTRRSTNLTDRDREPSQPRREDTSGTLVSEPKDRKEKDPEKSSSEALDVAAPTDGPSRSPTPPRANVFAEGDHVIVENEDGDVIMSDENGGKESPVRQPTHQRRWSRSEGAEQFQWTLTGFRKKIGEVYANEVSKRKEKDRGGRHQEPARAYQFGNTVSLLILQPSLWASH
jgi:Na(+)/H(+) antiporter